MFTGLVLQRNGAADEVPLIFSVTKLSTFSEDVAEFKFKAEVWIPQAELNEKSAALANFVEQITTGGSAESFDLVFGPPRGPPGMRVHPGTCTVQFLIQESGNIAVSAYLLSVSPGVISGGRYDTCTINFDTHLADVQDFLEQLQQSSALGLVAAILRGFEAVG